MPISADWRFRFSKIGGGILPNPRVLADSHFGSWHSADFLNEGDQTQWVEEESRFFLLHGAGNKRRSKKEKEKGFGRSRVEEGCA